MSKRPTRPQKIICSILGGLAFYLTPFSANAVVSYFMTDGPRGGSLQGALWGLTAIALTCVLMSHGRPTRRHVTVFLLSVSAALLPLVVVGVIEDVFYTPLSSMMLFGMRWHELYAVSYMLLISLLATGLMFRISSKHQSAHLHHHAPQLDGMPSQRAQESTPEEF